MCQTVTKDGIQIGNWIFNNNLQVVTSVNYYNIAALHNLQSLHTNILSISALVFTDLSRKNYNSLTELHTSDIRHK
jgi:hypothetical protein